MAFEYGKVAKMGLEFLKRVDLKGAEAAGYQSIAMMLEAIVAGDLLVTPSEPANLSEVSAGADSDS